MSITKYEIFEKVASVGNITKAAVALSCTQSGVSRSIAALEEELGLILFERGRNGAKLTEAGECLLPKIRAFLKAEAGIRRAAAGLRGEISGVVCIGAFTSVAVHWLPGILKEFEQSYPNVRVEMLNGDYHDISCWLRKGSIDIGFITLPCEVEDCSTIPLAEDRLLAILPQGHRLSKLQCCPLSELAKEDFISLMENSDHDARRALDAAGVKANVKYITKDDYAIIAMVEQGLGVSIMPELLLKGRTDNLCAVELDKKMSRTISLAIPSSSGENTSVSQFAEHIRRWVAVNNK